MELRGEAGKQQAHGTGELESLKGVGMVIGSIGYKARELNGMDPIDTWTHQSGRLDGHDRVYLAGWLKVYWLFLLAEPQVCVQRGPTGIIGTNIPDAKETAKSILSDVADGLLPDTKGHVK